MGDALDLFDSLLLLLNGSGQAGRSTGWFWAYPRNEIQFRNLQKVARYVLMSP